MTGMLKSIGMLSPQAAAQPLQQPAQPQAPQPRQIQNPFAAPSRTELQAIMARAGTAGVRAATQDDAGAVVRLFMAGYDDKDALADVAWAVKMGGSIPDAVAKVIATRQTASGRALQPGGIMQQPVGL